jgi:molybdenum cofactor synthesis domain-containing protein
VIALEVARERVLAACPRLHPSARPLEDALGCVTSVALVAPEAVPPFDNSAVDGYAVHAGDTANAPVELPVAGLLPAGAPPDIEVPLGGAVRIMTGAALPPGATAVVMVEDTESLDGGEKVRINRSVAEGDAVRRAGDDVKPGDEVLPAGTVVHAAHLGVLASLGFRRVPVFPPARVGVLSTGDELVADGGPLRPGQIRESNKAMLLGLVAGCGAIPVDLGLVRDDEAELTSVLAQAAATCDAVVSSGGVSMGDFDIVKAVLDRLAVDAEGRPGMAWMQVAIRPAKPFAFGLLRPAGRPSPIPVFGLPGNPVSSLISFELLARPALRSMMGHRDLDRPHVRGVADHDLRRSPDDKVHFVRVIGRFDDDGRFHVRSVGAQGSHQLAATAAANALAVLHDGHGVTAGSDVDVILLTDL